MSSFDDDVAIIGSGFGGSVAALRAAEKGYRVGVMEAGKQWEDADLPKSNWELKDYVWFPAAEMYGIQRIEYFDDMLILCGVSGHHPGYRIPRLDYCFRCQQRRNQTARRNCSKQSVRYPRIKRPVPGENRRPFRSKFRHAFCGR